MSSVSTSEEVSFGAQIHCVAEDHPDEIAVLFAAEDGTEREVTWREFDQRSTQLARVLIGHGLRVGDRLAICMRNSPEHLMSSFGAWKVGAVAIPMRWDLPEWERNRVLETIEPRLVIDAEHPEYFAESASAATERLPDVVSPNAWGVCSSGSTGSPKVIMMNSPGVYYSNGAGSAATLIEAYGPLPQPQRPLIPAPLYHTNGFTATRNLLAGESIVLMERFNASRVLDLVERHRITCFIAASPMLQRIAAVPDVGERDLSSIDWIQQGAAPLPEWLGRRWCELVGPEHFFVSYGSSEALGVLTCRGDEWLAHPGTSGRGDLTGTEIKILDDDGKDLPTGEVGAIYLRSANSPGAFYVGRGVTQLTRTEDGFATVGDLGRIDEDGYVYLADRRTDMIVTGGVNVYPAEVEAALSEHPQIADVVVIGLSDPEWGRRVHAVVQPVNLEQPPATDEVISFAKARLASYKAPKTIELVESLHRSDAMKLNRSALVAERENGNEVTASSS